MHPFVRDETLNVAIKSPAQVEYAAALIQLGLVAEGNEMLSHLNEDLYPEAQMHRVLGLFQEWNYLDAIQFRDYAGSDSPFIIGNNAIIQGQWALDLELNRWAVKPY